MNNKLKSAAEIMLGLVLGLGIAYTAALLVGTSLDVVFNR